MESTGEMVVTINDLGLSDSKEDLLDQVDSHVDQCTKIHNGFGDSFHASFSGIPTSVSFLSNDRKRIIGIGMEPVLVALRSIEGDEKDKLIHLQTSHGVWGKENDDIMALAKSNLPPKFTDVLDSPRVVVDAAVYLVLLCRLSNVLKLQFIESFESDSLLYLVGFKTVKFVNTPTIPSPPTEHRSSPTSID